MKLALFSLVLIPTIFAAASDTSNKPIDKPNKITDKTIDKIIDKPIDKITDKTTDKITDKPTDKLTDEPIEFPPPLNVEFKSYQVAELELYNLVTNLTNLLIDGVAEYAELAGLMLTDMFSGPYTPPARTKKEKRDVSTRACWLHHANITMHEIGKMIPLLRVYSELIKNVTHEMVEAKLDLNEANSTTYSLAQ